MSDLHNHDRGLVFDLETLYARRTALRMLAGAGLATLVGCSTDEPASSGTGSTVAAPTSAAPSSASASVASTVMPAATEPASMSSPPPRSAAGSALGPSATSPTATSSRATSESETVATSTAAASCDEIPEETAGPFPGDGSNGPNVLTQSGIVRSDITKSFGSSATTADGVRLTVKLKFQSTGKSCGPLSGAAVYVWHCDMKGDYSLYSQNLTDENYLRGVQATDATGTVTFKTIFPGAYPGRWPHVHFEVYSSLSDATEAGRIKATSQMALPQDACDKIYATAGYEQSVINMKQTTLASDMVFGDDQGVHQLATMTGNVTDGFTATLVVGV